MFCYIYNQVDHKHECAQMTLFTVFKSKITSTNSHISKTCQHIRCKRNQTFTLQFNNECYFMNKSAFRTSTALELNFVRIYKDTKATYIRRLYIKSLEYRQIK